MRKLLAGAAFAAITTLAGQASAATNLLVNGSFETGDFTGWTLSGNLGYLSVLASGGGGYPSEDGNYYVNFGAVGSDSYVSQTFTDVAGGTLDVSGWLAGNGSGYSEFDMEIDGIEYVFVSPVPDQGYVQYSFTAPATGSDTFTVSLRNDPSFDAADNFVVTQAVPEASTWAMMVLGFAGLGFAGFRARRTTVTAI